MPARGYKLNPYICPVKIAPNPSVSVVLPFYDNGPELERAIQSILSQSFTDYELLLVNNNAHAGAANIADRMAAKDGRIHILYEPKQGIAHAINRGLQHFKGEFIARMDGDDFAHPQRLRKQIEFLRERPDIDAVATQTGFETSLENAEGYQRFVDWQNSIISPEQHALSRFRESPVAHPSMLFRASLIDRYGLYSTAELPEDYELWLRWLNQGVRFYKLPEKLLIWNDHPLRLSRRHGNYSKEAFFVTKCRYMATWLKDNLPAHKKVVICGASKIGRKRGDLLQSLGVDIYGYTDVKHRLNKQINFIPIAQLNDPNPWFLINFIGKRGVGEAIARHFTGLGFAEGTDFILGA